MDGDKKQDAKAPEAAGWQYKPGSNTPAQMAAEPSVQAEAIEWSASEFVAHEKGFSWYAFLALGTAVVAVVLYFVTRDLLSVIVVVVMAAILAVAGSHKPRVVTYRLDNAGLTAGKKFYPYSAYKSFSMPDDGGPFTSIVLVPLKRLSFPTGAYLAPDSQQEVLELLSSHLPLERGELSFFDELVAHLRF